MTTYEIIATIIGVLVLLIISIAIVMTTYLVKPKYYSLEKSYQIEDDRGFIGDYINWKREPFILNSFDNYKIYGEYIPNSKQSNKFVIISHGYTYTRYGSIKYAHLFRKLGYNVIIYDDRGHGENNKYKCTLGYIESKDLIELIKYTYKRFGKDIFLGLHGESMGGGLQIMATQYTQNIKFIINDCGIGDLESIMKHQARKKYHLPKFIVDVANLFSKLIFGFNIKDVSPKEIIKNNKVPVCFFHGSNDRFIPPEQAQWLSDNNGGYSELHYVEGASHAQSYAANPESYEKLMANFIKNVENGEIKYGVKS